MTPFATNFATLLFKWQTVDLNNVIKHAREYIDRLVETFPVESGFVSKRVKNKTSQIDRTKQASAIRRKWLFATGVGCTNAFVEPVVVHLIDLVDQDETRLGKIIGGGHDQVPQATCWQGTINTAGNKPFFIDNNTLV